MGNNCESYKLTLFNFTLTAVLFTLKRKLDKKRKDAINDIVNLGKNKTFQIKKIKCLNNLLTFKVIISTPWKIEIIFLFSFFFFYH